MKEDKLKIFLKNLSRIIKKGIYIEDVAETFPGGWPRHNLGYYLLKNGFKIKETFNFSEPFNPKKLSDPKDLANNFRSKYLGRKVNEKNYWTSWFNGSRNS